MRISQRGTTLAVGGFSELNRLKTRQFQEALRNAISAPPELLHIDLAGSGNMDCAGLGALISVRTSVFGGPAAGSVALANATPATVRLLAITGANHSFTIRHDE